MQTQCCNTEIDTITYRVGEEMVYVPPQDTYDEALRCARQVFPSLHEKNHDQLALMLTVDVCGVSRTVRISPMSWPSLRKRLAQFEILDVIAHESAIFRFLDMGTIHQHGGPEEKMVACSERKKRLARFGSSCVNICIRFPRLVLR